MRFLIDNAVSPSVSRGLTDAGHDSVHVRDLGLQQAPDPVLFDLAANQGRILVSADTDFGTLLARRKSAKPSVVLFRHGAERQPSRQLMLLLANLPPLADTLESGAIVTIEPSRVRVRSLPLS